MCGSGPRGWRRPQFFWRVGDGWGVYSVHFFDPNPQTSGYFAGWGDLEGLLDLLLDLLHGSIPPPPSESISSLSLWEYPIFANVFIALPNRVDRPHRKNHLESPLVIGFLLIFSSSGRWSSLCRSPPLVTPAAPAHSLSLLLESLKLSGMPMELVCYP
jgi:hypothetical protein